MIVVDTSPLNYLVLIGEIELLPALFSNVLVPQTVFHELQHPKTSLKLEPGQLTFPYGLRSAPWFQLQHYH